MYFLTEKIGRIRGLSLSELGARSVLPSFGLPRRCEYKVEELAAFPRRKRSTAMPSVGMRSSTRVFGARVLRSGRRLWTEPQGGSKYTRPATGENEWNDLVHNSVDGRGNADRHIKEDEPSENENGAAMDIVSEPKFEENESEDGMVLKNVDRMFGIVYRRKRKRAALTSSGLSEDKRFGKQFVRKQWRKKCRVTQPLEVCGDARGSMNRFGELAIVVCESSNHDTHYWITCFLISVLIYMTKVRIGMRQLSAFVFSRPIFDAYFSRGILFLKDSMTIKTPGVCIISRSRSLIPVFIVDFSAIPFCFMDMHRCMYLRSLHLSGLLVARPVDVDEKDEDMIDLVEHVEELSFQIPSVIDHSDSIAVGSPVSSWEDVPHSNNVASGNDESGNFAPSAVGLPKSSLRNIMLRNSRNIQKRRSSLRRNRGRPSIPLRARRTSEALASDFLRIRHDGSQVSTVAPSHMLRSLDKRSFPSGFIEPKSNVGMTQSIRARSCSANLLIIEADKCYREEGATVILEQSPSKRWFLAVKKNGIKRYTLIAQKVMRLPCSNRFTHATIWVGSDCWRLEFLNKQDFLIFKEIYKECWDRNVLASGVSAIPIPRVQEVSNSDNSSFLPFVRPDSYIRWKDDELTRALLKKSANYDMDSDDEEWLKKFNEELFVDRGVEEVITPEKFELIIDALEKGFHLNADENYDEQATCDLHMYTDRKEVVEALRDYWIKKRKQKFLPLVRIFQLYNPRRTPVIPTSILRKKRSFKRQASKGGRGKPQIFLRGARPSELGFPKVIALTAERDALEQQNNLQKVKETKSAADRFEGLAVLKRQRAQRLMENADLATYKAVVALKIAEAARFTESSGTVASFVLG